MTSRWLRTSLVLGLLAPASAAASHPVVDPGPSARPLAPAAFGARIDQLGLSFPGRVGIAVQSIDDRWRTGWKESDLYPQQSVSKMWVALTAMEAVDTGRVRLTDPVTLTGGDLTLFHQPISALVRRNGAHTTTLGALMFEAITKSDNTANDKLMRAVGGPDAVRRTIADKRLGSIRFFDGERALQSKIAGLAWSQSYSVGDAFYRARGALPLPVRQSLFNRYIADPYDGAAPASIADALARLKRGELLSPASTARLLTTMSNTRTGANRLKGGLRPGWTLAHKTGTGQVLGATQAGYNDIGVLTAPDGRSYAVAVMIGKTAAPLGVRMTLMNNVVRAVIAQHETSAGSALTFSRLR